MNLAEDVSWDLVNVCEKLTVHLEVEKTARLAAFVDSTSRGRRYRRLHFGKQWFEQLLVECVSGPEAEVSGRRSWTSRAA